MGRGCQRTRRNSQAGARINAAGQALSPALAPSPARAGGSAGRGQEGGPAGHLGNGRGCSPAAARSIPARTPSAHRAAHHLLRHRSRDLLRKLGRPREREEAANSTRRAVSGSAMAEQACGRAARGRRRRKPAPCGPGVASLPGRPEDFTSQRGCLPRSALREETAAEAGASHLTAGDTDARLL